MKEFLVLRGFAGEYYDGSPCLLVELDDELRKCILDRVADAEKMTEKHGTSFHSLDFFDYTGEWFDMYSLDEEREDVQAFHDRVYTDESFVLPEDSAILKHIQEKVQTGQYDGGAHIRTDCDTMVVTTDRVYFKMYPKHTEDFRVESTSISTSYLLGTDAISKTA